MVLPPSFSLNFVLYVPKFPFNLIVKLPSVLIAQSPFFLSIVCFRMSRRGRRLAEGLNVVACIIWRQTYLEPWFSNHLSLLFSNITVLVIPLSKFEKGWFSHASLRRVSVLLLFHVKSMSLVSPHVEGRVSSPFHLVHSDIWGTMGDK